MRHFETRAVHAGEKRGRDGSRPNGLTSISTPLYLSTTFPRPDMESMDAILSGELEGYSYGRYGNPTVRAFEEAMEALEGGDGRAFAFSSGMAATHAALLAAELTQGATVLAAEQLYGSTAALMVQLFGSMGVETTFVDSYDLEAVRKKAGDIKPRALVVESISNPLLRVADTPRLAEIAHGAGAALIVDNTFATPYLQRPLELGADIVIYSATKYLGGHADLTAGLAVAREPYAGPLGGLRTLVGGILSPFEAWLALRGLKTLPLRLGRQCENAHEVASYLAGHPKVEKVYHPATKDHPDGEVARRVLGGSGGLVSFEIRDGDRQSAFRFLEALEVCVMAPSLGDIYTLAIHPPTASHRDLSPARREKLGVKENLIRISCGIEHPQDLISDLEQALEKA